MCHVSAVVSAAEGRERRRRPRWHRATAEQLLGECSEYFGISLWHAGAVWYNLQTDHPKKYDSGMKIWFDEHAATTNTEEKGGATWKGMNNNSGYDLSKFEGGRIGLRRRHAESYEFQKNGYVILENFFQSEEIEELRACGEEFTNKLPPESERKVFDTIQLQQNKDKYFLDSANKISVFFETEALEEDGRLKVHPRVSLNKVGHALHWLHPVFKKYTFDERVKEVAFQLDYEEPVVCQSMYIYKNPGIGSEVTMHQDASYLYVEPVKLVGFWIALEDATLENGCLWIAPGSHQSGVHRRYMRNKDPNSQELLIFDRAAPCYPLSNFRPVPVRKGTCILIHGQVVHFSYPNKSETSRHAYTFHVIETKHVSYSKENWLQPPADGFASLYKN